MTLLRTGLLLLMTVLPPVIAPANAADGRVLRIGQVQGSGERSPLEGQVVTVEGVVTGAFASGMGGVFIQDAGDKNPATSDGLLVMPAQAQLPPLQAGDRIRVRGRVQEENNKNPSGTTTTLRAEHIEVRGRGKTAPAAAVLTAPPQDWEPLEGMRVQIKAKLSLNGTDARFGETLASFDGRLWTPTEIAQPGSEQVRKIEADNARRRLLLDDGDARRDPQHIWYLPNGEVRGGSTINSAEGIVEQRHGSWRLQLTEPLQVEHHARTERPEVAGKLRLAVFNMENMFNGDGRGNGFPTSRGARTPQQLIAQTAKLVTTLRALDADVAALMELENDGYSAESSIAQFVDALNAGAPGEQRQDWHFIDTGAGPGIDTIRVGIIYRASRVQPVGKFAVLESEPFGERSRVPLAQAFRKDDGLPFTVVANHFKSKGCSEATGDNVDKGDGQGCWNALRVESARKLDAWMKTDPTGSGGRAVLVGDFNSYAMEDPLRVMREAGWQDAFVVAGVEQPYSYMHEGRLGRLDHALLSPQLAKHLRGAAEWHINADEPRLHGYSRSNTPGPWRSSDHDPLLLGFDL